MIPEANIKLHLKLGRILACFVNVDTYFESKTFNWIQLEKTDSAYKATLIRTVDEGDELFNEILEFDTVNNIDPNENEFMEGSLDVINQWMLGSFNLQMNSFQSLDELKHTYKRLVKEGLLGR